MKLGPIDALLVNYRHKGEVAIRDYMAEYVAQAPRPDFYRAMAYAEAGDSENAIRSLTKAVRQRDFEVLEMLNCPEFDSLHSDRRFQQLVLLVGLRPQKSGSPQL